MTFSDLAKYSMQ